MSGRMRRRSEGLELEVEDASSKVFIRNCVEVAHPLLHEPLHRTGLATLRKLLDQRGGVRDVADLVASQPVVQERQAMPPLGGTVSEQHRPLQDVMHERPDLRDVHLDEIVQGDRAWIRSALMGFERASLAVAGGERSELGMEVVIIDEARESEL